MSGVYRFSLGAFECYAVSDGSHDYPPADFFNGVPADIVRAELDRVGAHGDVVTTPYTFLVVDTGAFTVLVDLGAGSLFPTTGHLATSVQSAGFEPADIDHVVISHAHPDHVGGALGADGRLRYGGASYFIRRREWEFWFSLAAEEKSNATFVDVARRNLEPMRPAVTLVDDEAEILPGVAMLEAPGHTPGHSVVSFVSGSERLLFVADTVIHPLHLEHPDWLPVYDILPEEAAVSKRRVFDLAADEQCMVLGQHFPPFPSLGRVERRDVGWCFRPV